jgi:predicted RecB family endonuclease
LTINHRQDHRVTEAEAILAICSMLGGQSEVRHHYPIADGNEYVNEYVVVDCETETHVIEVGLDKRSSLDSVQQAEFFAWVTGKLPMMIIVDQDGIEGQYEYQIKRSARRLGIRYYSYTSDYLLRWLMTSYFRDQAN